MHIPLKKYPKLCILTATFVGAYLLFHFLQLDRFSSSIASLGYAGTFIAGILFSYGFTAGPATALLLIFGKEQVWWVAAVIAALGSVIGNLLIFHIVRFSVADEIERLEHAKPMLRFEHALPLTLQHHIAPVLAGFIMASPLPDEVALSLLAGIHRISARKVAALSFVLHFIGIAAIIGVGKLV